MTKMRVNREAVKRTAGNENQQQTLEIGNKVCKLHWRKIKENLKVILCGRECNYKNR